MRITKVKVTGDRTPDGTTVLVDGEELERVQRIFTVDGRLYVTVQVAANDWAWDFDSGDPGADFDISVRRYDVRDPRLANA